MPLKTLIPPEASPRTLPFDVAAVTPAASAAESRAHGAADAPATRSAACLTNVLRLDALIFILRKKYYSTFTSGCATARVRYASTDQTARQPRVLPRRA